MPKDPHERKQRDGVLKYGILLTMHYAAGKPPTVAAIEEFLGKALIHFKEWRDVRHEALYTGGPWEAYAIDARKIRGTGVLSYAADDPKNHLSTAHWVNALADAYSTANTLSQMTDQLDAYRAQADGWVKDVVTLLEKKNGALDAFEIMLNR